MILSSFMTHTPTDTCTHLCMQMHTHNTHTSTHAYTYTNLGFANEKTNKHDGLPESGWLLLTSWPPTALFSSTCSWIRWVTLHWLHSLKCSFSMGLCSKALMNGSFSDDAPGILSHFFRLFILPRPCGNLLLLVIPSLRRKHHRGRDFASVRLVGWVT